MNLTDIPSKVPFVVTRQKFSFISQDLDKTSRISHEQIFSVYTLSFGILNKKYKFDVYCSVFDI